MTSHVHLIGFSAVPYLSVGRPLARYGADDRLSTPPESYLSACICLWLQNDEASPEGNFPNLIFALVRFSASLSAASSSLQGLWSIFSDHQHGCYITKSPT